MDQDATWYEGRPRPRPHYVTWGPSSPPLQRGTDLQFSAHICCGQMARWIKMLLGRKVDLDTSDIVLNGGPSSPPQKRGQSPQFSAHVYCGQTAGWIKMPLGTKVGLSPGRIVTWGPSSPIQKGHSPPPKKIGPCLLWPNGRSSQLLLSTCFIS